MRRWWCDECRSGVVLARWVARPICGTGVDEHGQLVSYGPGTHPPAEMRALDLDHACDGEPL